jgi:hypothetical protein
MKNVEWPIYILGMMCFILIDMEEGCLLLDLLICCGERREEENYVCC